MKQLYPMKPKKKNVITYTKDNNIPVYEGTEQHKEYLQFLYDYYIAAEIKSVRKQISDHIDTSFNSNYYNAIAPFVPNNRLIRISDVLNEAYNFGWVIEKNTEYDDVMTLWNDLLLLDYDKLNAKYGKKEEPKKEIPEPIKPKTSTFWDRMNLFTRRKT